MLDGDGGHYPLLTCKGGSWESFPPYSSWRATSKFVHIYMWILCVWSKLQRIEQLMSFRTLRPIDQITGGSLNWPPFHWGMASHGGSMMSKPLARSCCKQLLLRSKLENSKGTLLDVLWAWNMYDEPFVLYHLGHGSSDTTCWLACVNLDKFSWDPKESSSARMMK